MSFTVRELPKAKQDKRSIFGWLHELSRPAFLGQPLLNDGAGFFQAKAPQFATTVGLDSFVKFSSEFFGRDFIPRRREALQQLKSRYPYTMGYK